MNQTQNAIDQNFSRPSVGQTGRNLLFSNPQRNNTNFINQQLGRFNRGFGNQLGSNFQFLFQSDLNFPQENFRELGKNMNQSSSTKIVAPVVVYSSTNSSVCVPTTYTVPAKTIGSSVQSSDTVTTLTEGKTRDFFNLSCPGGFLNN